MGPDIYLLAVSNLVFYVQSTITVTSGRYLLAITATRIGEEKKPGGLARGSLKWRLTKGKVSEKQQ